MPLNPTQSTQYRQQFSALEGADAGDVAAQLKFAYVKLTFLSAGQGLANMVRLPSGRIRILSDLSRVTCPAGISGAVLSVGHSGFVRPDGTVQAAVPNAFVNAQSITAAIDMAFNLPAAPGTGGATEVDAKGSGTDVTVTISTQNSPASGDLILAVAYMVRN